ncbi:MAG: electron transfer flavoprotein beta subunit [Flavobacteriales bacterium]|jgi:electron transfer flavoprotein beta subunit
MKVLVPVKRVLDHSLKVRFKDDGSNVDLTNLKMAINPFCEIAVEEAVRLRDAGIATEIVVVSIGQAKAQDQIRSAFGLGADRGILVKTETDLEPLAIAKCLKALVDKEAPELIILGKQSIDGDNNQTGQMLAALCGYPQATFASKLEVADGKALVTREIDGGLQTISIDLPAVVTTDLRLNTPRLVQLATLMKSKKKPIETIELSELGVDVTPRTELLSVSPPAKRAAGVIVGSVDELVDKLKNEAKVI